MNRLIETYLSRRSYDEQFLSDINNDKHDKLLSIDELCAELKVIHDAGDHLVILPDFDMDGITSGVINFAGLSELGFNVSLFRPTPSDGYGFNEQTIQRLVNEFPDVKAIITCDVGITCYQGVAAANLMGIKVLITDHHLQEAGKENLLYANVVVNPNRTDETYKNKGICGAHVAWQILYQYSTLYESAFMIEQIRRLRVFAGIGTISDMMPLVYENRPLVKDACHICRLVHSNGSSFFVDSMLGCVQYVRAFRGLYEVLNVFADAGKITKPGDINEEFFGYYLAPMFNSVKRLNGNMDVAFGVFFGGYPKDSASTLYSMNEERKAAVASYFNTLMSDNQPYAPYIYLSDAPSGILGLLATKLIKLTGEPTLVLAKGEGNNYHGSGRAPSWFSAVSLIRNEGFFAAGHEGAFGVGVTDKRELKSLFAFLAKTADDIRPDIDDSAELAYDIHISTLDNGDTNIDIPLFIEFISELRRLAPFGKGFEAPIVMFTFRPEDAEWTTMGSLKQHVKGTFPYGFELLCWNQAQLLSDWQDASLIHVFGHLGISEFRDRRTVNFIGNEVVCE